MIANLLICLRFFSRLPVPETTRETELGAGALPQAVAMAPVAGVAIGLVPAVVLLAFAAAGLPPFVCAALAIAALVAATGALHEDGLADCADGFGGGATRERKLEIMRDSRIGTFGACVLGLSLIIRIGALAEIIGRSSGGAALVVVAAAAVSRALCLWPLALLVPVRPDGAGASASRLEGTTVFLATAIAAVFLVAIGVLSGHFVQALAAGAFSALAAIALCGLAHRQIGGQTGDVAGSVQQVAEIAVLLVFAASIPTLAPLAQ